MILDAKSDRKTVKEMLSGLLTHMDELQKRAFEYKTYQKNFRVSVYFDCSIAVFSSAGRHLTRKITYRGFKGH
jgi:hypothetical protein